MNVVLLLGGAAAGLAALVALAAAKSWKPALWALGGLLAISPSALAAVPGLGDETVFKAGMLTLLGLLAARVGVRVRWPVGLLLVAFTVALAVSLSRIVPGIAVDPALALKAFAGYCLTLAALLIRWRREHLPALLQVLVALPLLSGVLGVLLQVAGQWQAVADGRLGGALIGPHLAMLSVAAASAALTGLVVLQQARWAAWLLLDSGLTFLTLTRGAMLASALLLLVLAVWTVTARHTAHRPALKAGRRVLLAAIVAAAAMLPLILARNEGNAYEGSFNTSGREQAWPFYLSLSEDSPLFGRGLGYASVANALLRPFGVQAEFQSPHNEYIHLWVDGGLLLAVPFFVGLVALAAAAGRACRQPLLLLGLLAATLLYSFVDNTFSTPQYAIPFGLLLAGLTARRPDVPRTARPRLTPASAPVLPAREGTAAR